MITLACIASAFAAVIVVGTLAAWAYDTLEARLAAPRPARGRDAATLRSAPWSSRSTRCATSKNRSAAVRRVRACVPSHGCVRVPFRGLTVAPPRAIRVSTGRRR